jgi:L-arabinokinase
MNPSYRIVFYVSGHGFGHTSRAIEVIHALLRAQPEARIVVKTSAPLRLFARTLQGRCELVELQCDAGMVQIDSLNVDTAASIRQAVDFQTRVPALIATEASYLRESEARVAVGDIPPVAAAAALAAGIPSVTIGNFTWDWIYESYREQPAFELAREIRALYRRATIALRLPMAGGFAGLESITRDIPFIARHSHRTQDDVRGALGLPPRAAGKPLVLVSFGGYGVAGLDTAGLSTLNDFTIATTDSPVSAHAIKPATGLLYISEQQLYDSGLRYEDLVRGADVIVTKPGYGIISEAIANGAALLYTSRGHFVEYDVLVREMPRYLRAEFIERQQLLNGDWGAALRRLLSQPAPPERPPLNGAEIAAGEILHLVTTTE